MKSYLFAYSQVCPQERAHAVLNDTNGISSWVAPFPYSAIIVSNLDIGDLAAILRNRLPGIWLLVTEMNHPDVDGWLPRNLWRYVNDPSLVATEQPLLPPPPTSWP